MNRLTTTRQGRNWLAVIGLLFAFCGLNAQVVTFPAGPTPSADAPVAVAVDSVRGRLYVVQRALFGDQKVNDERMPTDAVTVVDLKTGNILAVVKVGKGLNGIGQGIAVDVARNRIYVPNDDEGTVSVIDGASNKVLNAPRVGKEPKGVAVDSTGLVYVANSGESSVTVLDASGAVKGTVALSGPAWSVAVDPRTDLAYLAVQSGPKSVAAVDGRTLSVRAQVDLPLLLSLKGIAVDPGSRVYVSSDRGLISVLDVSGSALREVNRIFVGENPNALAVDPTTRLLYVVETGNDRVSIYNSDGQNQKSVSVLRLPSAIALDPAAGRAYVTGTRSDSLSVVDTARQTLAGALPLGTLDFGLAYDSGAKRLYAANFAADAVSVIDATTRKVTASWNSGDDPWAVAVDPALKQIYNLNTFGSMGTLSILNSADGTVKATLDVGPAGAGAVAVNSLTHLVYVTGGSANSNTLTVVDGATNKVAATVTVGVRPVGIAIDEAAGRVYVANQQSGTISVVDARSHQVTATWSPRLGNVWGLAVDPTLRRLYVTVPASTIGSFNGLELLDMDRGDFLSQIAMGSAAALVAVNPRTGHVFATDSQDGTVTVVDGAARTVLATVTVGRGAHGLAVDQDGGLVYVANVLDGTVSVIEDKFSAPQASLVVSPRSLSFTYQIGGSLPASQPLSVSSSGAALAFSASASGGSWLTVNPGSGNTAATLSVSASPAGLAAGAYTGTITVSAPSATNSPQTVTVSLVVTSAGPASGPRPSAVVNAASYVGGAVAPGEIITIFGTNLGPASGIQAGLNSDGLVENFVGGTRVLFNGAAAPLLYVQANQVSAIVPYAVAGVASAQFQVEYQGTKSDAVSVPVASSAPGIFTYNASGKGPGAILNQDLTLNSASNPVPTGSIVVLFATGEGQTDPPGQDGALALLILPQPRLPVSVSIGGIPADVLYAGAAPYFVAGLLQVNARIPSGVAAGSAVPVLLTIGNATSQAGVTLAVK